MLFGLSGEGEVHGEGEGQGRVGMRREGMGVFGEMKRGGGENFHDSSVRRKQSCSGGVASLHGKKDHTHATIIFTENSYVSKLWSTCKYRKAIAIVISSVYTMCSLTFSCISI